MTTDSLFGSNPALPQRPPNRPEFILTQRPLARILAFTRRSIDDVINDPLARNEVTGYYKLFRWIHRESEIADLEGQWNPLGQRLE